MNGETDKSVHAGTVTVPDASALDSGNVSVEAWVKYSPNNVTIPIVAKQGAGGSMTTPQWSLSQAGTSTFSFSVVVLGRTWTVSASTSGYTGPTGPVSGWWHLVGTFDGQVLKLYLNGTLPASQISTLPASYAGPISTYPQPLVLGNNFNGSLDEVAVYNSALSQAQVQAHFNAASTVGCSDIAGATSNTYSVAAVDTASRLRVNVTATGDSGTTLASSNVTDLMTNQRPRMVAAPGVSGATAVGSTLTASSGSWTGADSLSYQWQRCSSYSAAVAASQPVGYWRLGEAQGAATAVDSSGYGNDGLYSGAALALGQPGALSNWGTETDTAMKSGTVTAPDGNALNTGTSVTVEAWVLADPNLSSTLPIVVKQGLGGSTTNPQYALYQAGTSSFSFSVTVLGRTWTANVATGGYTGPVGPVRSWWHLAGTYDGQAVRIYLNGTLAAGQTTTLAAPYAGPINTYAQPLVLGGFNGSLDEVAIYSSALSQSQIQAHFNAAATVGCTDVAGATGQTYTVAAADLGSRLRVNVSAANAAGSLVAASARTALATNERPRPTVSPTVTGTPLIASTLTASAGSWSGSPTSYAYQWQRCSSYAAAVAADQPTGWWRLGDPTGATTATDSSGYANDGAYSGNATRGPAALGSWNGETDTGLTLGSVTVPDANALNPTASSRSLGGVPGSGWTIEAWVKKDSNSFGNNTVLSKGPDWALVESSNSYAFTITRRVNQTTSTATASFSTSSYTGPVSPSGYWDFVMVVSGSTLRFYANGTLSQASQSVNFTGTMIRSGQPVRIAPTGSMDEVAVYNEALTAAQAQAHWNAGMTFGCVNIPGATGQTYSLLRADAGSRYRVVVTATNAVGAIASNSAQTTKVGFPFPGAPWQLTFGDGGGADAIDPSASIDGVDTATGVYSTSVTDASLAGIGVPFQLARIYSSADQGGDQPSGRLGPGWSDSYSDLLTVDSSTGNVTLHSDSGQWVVFNKQPDGSFKSDGATSSILATSSGGGYDMFRHDRTVLHFAGAGPVASIRDRNGQGISFAYGANPNCVTATDSGSRTIAFTCNSDGTVKQITLPDGRNVQYRYTGGLLTSLTDLAGGVWSYVYDSSNRLTRITDPNNHAVVTNTYDSATGRVVSQADALNHTTSFAWDQPTETATVTDPRGGVTTHTFLNNVLTKEVDPLGNATTYSYDAGLNETQIKDPRGNTTAMTYDAHHNMVTRVAPAPLSYLETWVYDPLNDITSYTDRRGNQTLYSYDANGNLISKTQPGNVVTQYGRDPSGTGLLVLMTDPRGKTTQYAYDSQHNLTSVTSPLNEVTTTGYDSSGRVTSVVDPRGNQSGAVPSDYRTTFAYDALDRKISQTNPLGNQTQWAYDPVGNLLSVTDANNHSMTYTYDAANQLISVTAPGGAVTSYTYDANGNIATRTDANSHVTTYAYDANDRLLTVTSPLNATWSYGYDANDNRIQTVSPTGTTTYGYDELNRSKTIAYSDATPSVSFSYDGNDNRTQMTDGAGTVNYSYDSLNRVTQTSRGADTFAYSYDAAGNLTQRVYPGGTTTDYTYDDDSRLASASSGGATTSYSYDAAGNPIGTTRPASNGWNETRIYDTAGRLTEIKDANGTSTLEQLDYAYNPVGEATSLTRLDGVEYYQYDDRNRLTKVCYTAPCTQATDTISWTYDGVGNRLGETRPTGTTSYAYDAGDELTQTTGPNGTTTYGYDGSGNQTADGSTTYSYDLANRGTSATTGGSTITYAYDGDGNRFSETTGTTTTNLLWDTNNAMPQLALERDGLGNALRTYIRGLDTVALVEGGNTYYYHHDRLGSVTALTSSTGTTEWTYTYEPFGSPRTTNQVDPSAPTNPLGYVGQYQDPATNLLDLRARQYDTGTGRFLGVDPAPAGPATPFESTYVYAGDDPIDNYDLNGEAGVIPPGYCAHGGFGCAHGGGGGFGSLVHFVAHELEIVPYALYYLSYKNKGNFTVPQRDLTEHAGLAGDRALDKVAGTGDKDEGRRGHIFEKLPGIGYWGPQTYLPGVHKKGKKVDHH